MVANSKQRKQRRKLFYESSLALKGEETMSIVDEGEELDVADATEKLEHLSSS